MVLNCVEQEYVRLLKPQLAEAIMCGKLERAASFAKELAKIHRKSLRREETKKEIGAHDE